MQHVFIIGSKGIPGHYGGYETFVDRLTECHEHNSALKYHVACKAIENGEFEYHNARCFKIKTPNIGSAQAIWYDIVALSKCISYIEEHKIQHPIIYVLACRIGPFCSYFYKRIQKIGGKLYVNPDGHEWARAKWSVPVRRYWKLSESLMAHNCDLLICDSLTIEKYIHEEYGDIPTTYISYGAEVRKSTLSDIDPVWLKWLSDKGLKSGSYYLVVGRFVPENNYEIMIKEFMRSNSKCDFVLVTNVNSKFLDELEVRTHYQSDPRIKFVGTVYDRELLMKIRENARAYLHGHEVGGTNPSLLEALGSTDLNLLLDVGFNREVARDSALYWTKGFGNLASLLNEVDSLNSKEISSLSAAAKTRITDAYSWDFIASQYESLFLKNVERAI